MLYPSRKLRYHYRNKYYYDNQRRRNRKRKAIKIAKAIVKLTIVVVLAVLIVTLIIPQAQLLVSGHSAIIGFNYYTLRDSTYNEMIAFIRGDKTNEHIYSFPDYVCEDFSRGTQYNAIKAGYRCGVVNIQFEGGQSVQIGNTIYENGHAIICFETIDKGLIFIEPQHDDIVKIQKGCSFSQLNNYIQTANDIITGYSISWFVIDPLPKN